MCIVWGRGPSSFFCMWISTCPSIICWKDSPSPEWTGYSCWKSVVYKREGYFWALNSITLIYMPVLMPVLQCIDHCSFLVRFEIGKCEFSNFIFVFQGLFWLFWVPSISIWILESACQYSAKNLAGLLMQNALSLYNNLGILSS